MDRAVTSRALAIGIFAFTGSALAEPSLTDQQIATIIVNAS
jgi:hypothetical protein